MTRPDVLRTIAGPLQHEPEKIKGSRFIASLAPASSAEEAQRFVARCRATFRDATHHCFAWRIGLDPNRFRYSDDGEPSGTAGRPILQEIDGRDLHDLVVVVIRYYGGTKLGTGGLVRAYGGAAAAALARVEVVERPIVEVLTLRHDYGATSAVQRVLSSHGLAPFASAYGQQVCLRVEVPIAIAGQVRDGLREATAGRIEVTAIADGPGTPGPSHGS